MDRFDRIFAFHKLLANAKYPIPGERLKKELECSQSTLMRTANAMRDYLGAPLEYDRKTNGWFYNKHSDHPYELPGLWFNAEELSALLTIYQLLRDLQPGLLGEQINPFKNRIESLLKAQHIDSNALQSRIKLMGIGVRNNDPFFKTVAQAVLQRQRLDIEYHARSSDQKTQRLLSPQRIIYYRNNWYLDAYCHTRHALRSFSLDRIKKATINHKPCRPISEQILEDYYNEAYGIFSGKVTETATLLFNAKRAAWVAEERWHNKQQGRFLSDGSYELKIPYSHSEELMMDILKYGADVQVLEPASLRAAIKQSLVKTLALYEKN